MNASDEFDKFEGIEEDIAPTKKLSIWLLLSDFFSALGDIIENVATIPNDISLRIQGHIKWKESQKLNRAEVARTIEQIEEYANDDRNR